MGGTCEFESPIIHDVVIVGAGPCGLAAAARLCEQTPSAIFTDDEHQRYNWIYRHTQQMTIKNRKNGTEKPAKPLKSKCKYSTVVLDSSGSTWMSRWNKLFKTFDIRHLRSPMFFHVDPGDRDGLLAFTYEEGREDELVEIKGCVGKEISKHQKKKKRASGNAQASVIIEERDRKDYQTPSTPLFGKYCSRIVDRYHLCDSPILEASVTDVTYGHAPDAVLSSLDDCPKRVFTITTSRGTYYSRTVILSLGPANAPSIPCSLSTPLPNAIHSMHVTTFPSTNIVRKMSSRLPTQALVIGGGLTSAQLSDLLLRRGVTHVTHLIRGPLRIKPFDIDLAWMGKYRNLNQAYFYGAESDQERAEMIKKARGGGSITPGYAKLIREWERKGRLTVHENTTIDITRSEFDDKSGTWSIATNPPCEVGKIDFIYFATGVQTDVRSVPCLQSMLRENNIESCAGLPCLTDDLMWKEDVPLFVTGKLAGLRLGPGAANLGGARAGAERVVWGVEEWLEKTGNLSGGTETTDREEEAMKGAKVERRDSAQDRDEYASARGNRFRTLDFEGMNDDD